MKIKELIEHLKKCDPEMDIILEPHIDCADDEISCYLPWDIINDDLPELGLRLGTVNTYIEPDWEDGKGREIARFEDIEDPIQSRTVVILSSTQFKYGEGEDSI